MKFFLVSQRFHITYVPESSSYRLRIEDIQETDGAIYQCQVLISLTDKEVAEVPLIVRQPPVISDNSTRSVVATEGQESASESTPIFIYYLQWSPLVRATDVRSKWM